MTEQDGRRRKGELRRRALLDATLRIVEQHGVAGVSQRAVAQEAGVPPSAVLYYFASVDDLIVATLAACNDRYIERIVEIAATLPAERLPLLAAEIANGAATSRTQVLAEFDLLLLAARRPDMAAELQRWSDAVDTLVAALDVPPDRHDAVAATIDGLFLRCACAPTPPDAQTVLAALRSLVPTRP
ncbi:TetR/AcrR family transcriptional regulator [Pseudonocardia sp. TRM90224]|uniref:TetR/AcrR family transcriptional regulator n=1 Tax=Pseudonocardia sp. TRM90224 TaxID=2812678 RepID=UPI001E4C11EE|nr:TetR family transcriptional regulator [Pseudonocardia sp. TRM90224]